MFPRVVVFLSILLLAVSQISILSNLFPQGAVPDLVLILVVYWTVRSGFSESLGRVILAGLILDLVYGWAIGLNVLSFSIVAFVVGYLAKRLSVSQRGWGFFVLIGFMAFGVLLNESVIFLVIQAAEHLRNIRPDNHAAGSLGLSPILIAVSTALSSLLLYWPMKRLDDFIKFYQKGQFTKTRFLK